MSDTTRLKLPLIAAQQAQKHVTHNESLLKLDVLVQARVLDRDLNTPPANPAEGDAYIDAASASGDWTGQEGNIAAWQNGGWVFHAPSEGWKVWVADEDALYVHDGTAWVKFETGITSVNPVPDGKLGINTTADATNRLAVKSDAVLFSHDDVTPGSGDVQFKVNKAAAANTASLLFQTGWSGRAELGTIGGDDFHIKVSPDGATWQLPLTIDSSTGNVGIFNASPKERLHLNGILRMQDTAAFIGFYDSAGTTRTGYFQAHATAGFYFAMELAQPMYFYTSGLLRLQIQTGGDVLPGADNAQSFGNSSYRWKDVWSVNGTIQTSDARDKELAGEIDFAGRLVDGVTPVLFRWKEGETRVSRSARLKVKDTTGEMRPAEEHEPRPGRRLHAGFLAQDIKQVLEEIGVDIAAWGLENADDPDSRQWLRPHELIAVLWEALRETRQRLAEIEEKVDASE